MSPQKNGPGDDDKKPMEMKVGDARLSAKSAMENKLRQESQGLKDPTSLEGVSLAPKSEKEKSEYYKKIELMSPEEARTKLTEIGITNLGDVPAKTMLGYINSFADVVDENAVKMNLTNEARVSGAKDFIINKSGKGTQYKISPDQWDMLNKGDKLSSAIIMYSKGRKDAPGPVEFKMGSVGVSESEPTGPIEKKSSQSKVVENDPTKAFIYIKDEDGSVRKEMKEVK